MRLNIRSYLLVLIGLCFVASLFLTVLDVGVTLTPWETRDSQGRTMGFNDQFSPEHYWIALGNFRPAAFFQIYYAYAWLLLVAQLVGAWCLWSEPRSTRRATRWYFLAQPAVFFIGTLSVILLIGPHVLVELLSFKADRESFIDIPLLEMLTQQFWVVVSGTIVFALPGQSLGLKEIGSALGRRLRPRQTLPAR